MSNNTTIIPSLKQLAVNLCLLRALPTLITYTFTSRFLPRHQAFSNASEAIAKISGTLGVLTRQALYKYTLKSTGRDIHFGFMSLFSKPDTTLGHRVYIGRFCSIGLADIHDDVMIADGVQILSGRHQHGSANQPNLTLRDNQQQFTKVTIAKGAWIGANAIIMADVGENAIVAAGAVVTQPVPDNTTAVGIPAKPLTRKAA